MQQSRELPSVTQRRPSLQSAPPELASHRADNLDEKVSNHHDALPRIFPQDPTCISQQNRQHDLLSRFTLNQPVNCLTIPCHSHDSNQPRSRPRSHAADPPSSFTANLLKHFPPNQLSSRVSYHLEKLYPPTRLAYLRTNYHHIHLPRPINNYPANQSHIQDKNPGHENDNLPIAGHCTHPDRLKHNHPTSPAINQLAHHPVNSFLSQHAN